MNWAIDNDNGLSPMYIIYEHIMLCIYSDVQNNMYN